MVPNIREDSSPNNKDSQVASGNKNIYNLGSPISSPYSTRLYTGSISQLGRG
jgi:hypothetical protein